MLRRTLTLLLLVLSARAFAQAPEADLIPSAEALALPTPARIAALAEKGAASGWAPVAGAARNAGFVAYEKGDRLPVAEAWHDLENWAQMFGETETAFTQGWIRALSDAKAAHANMAKTYAPRLESLGARLSPELRRWLLGNTSFSSEFFSLIQPVDFVPQVFALLQEMYAADPVRFKEYPSLALAIAVVYDVPPPPDWPHGQVSASLLPRRWPAASAAFAWWVREDKAGRTYQRLNRLRAEELKYVVDSAVSPAEREWSQKNVAFPLSDFDQAYSMIAYRMDRIQAGAYNWPGPGYRLADILAQGGICVDQAFFATEAGKARGVPTLFFRGEGLDGRHAWFGYLDQNQRWQLNAGRYAEQRYITGIAYDPQTWRNLNDHELKFIADRFRALPEYRQSRVHAVFADEYLQVKRPKEAAAAARKSVNYAPRNLDGWETLLESQKAGGAKPVEIEATLKEASIAVQNYPDLQIGFTNRLIESLRSRGETSRADTEERALIQKYQQVERSDLSVQQAAQILQRSFASQPIADQIRTYNQAVDTYGRGAGIDFFDKIVVVFAEHLLQLGQRDEALRAVDRARANLKIEPGKQLDLEMKGMEVRLKAPAAGKRG